MLIRLHRNLFRVLVFDVQRSFVCGEAKQVKAGLDDFALLSVMQVNGCLIVLRVERRVYLRLLLASAGSHRLAQFLDPALFVDGPLKRHRIERRFGEDFAIVLDADDVDFRLVTMVIVVGFQFHLHRVTGTIGDGDCA